MYTCVLILVMQCTCVLILLALFTCFRRGIHVSSYYSFYYICVLIGGEGGSGREASAYRNLLYVICVSSYYYICVLILYMCPQGGEGGSGREAAAD